MMNNPDRSSAKKVFILAAIVLPLVFLSLIVVGFSGLGGINPGNQGKTLVYYHFSEQQAEFIRGLSVYALIPLALVTGLLATLNLKLAKQFLNLAVLLLCTALVVWVFFASWAIEGDYIPTSKDTDHSLRIQQLNFQ